MKTPRIAVIAAMDRNGAIGKDNRLPWHLPDDLKRFKALTFGKPMLMGRKTAESLGRALPGRENLVLTRSGRVPFDGMEAVASFEEALARTVAIGANELCVIGGAEIYALTLAAADVLYLTHVDTAIEGADVHFPPLDPMGWRCIRNEKHAADARHAFAMHFVECVRSP